MDNFVDIPFGPYIPDLGGAPNPDIPGYLTDCVGLRPTANGYRGMPTFADVASAAAIGTGNSTWVGVGTDVINQRSFFVFSTADAKIYESQNLGQSWSDTTPAAGAALTFPANFLTFEGEVIFVCAARAPIYRTIEVTVGTDFANLPGSPPIARCGAVVRQHVFLGGLVGVDDYAVQWCANGDSHDWPTPFTADALAKESSRESLPQRLGRVTAIVGGEQFGIVAQEYGLTRFTYVGGDVGYQVDTYETQAGTGRHSGRTKFVTDGREWYWISERGLFATDGYSVRRLDDGRIEEALVNDRLGHTNGTTWPFVNICGAYDSHRHLIMFGDPDQNYQIGISANDGSLFWANESTVTDMFTGHSNVSSPRTTYGLSVYNINQSSRKLQALSGGNAADSGVTVALQTGYIELDPGYAVQIQGVHLLGALVPSNSLVPEALTISYKAASALTGVEVSQSGFTALSAASRGMKNLGRTTAQYYSFRVTGTASERQLLRGLRVYFTRAEPSP